MASFSNLLRNPFSFLFARRAGDDRVAAYLVREHKRGRALSEILEDNYVKNRCTPAQQARILDRPEVIHALGDDVAASAKAELT